MLNFVWQGDCKVNEGVAPPDDCFSCPAEGWAGVAAPCTSAGASTTPLLDRLTCLVKSKSFDAEDKKTRSPGSPDIRVHDAPDVTPADSEWTWTPTNDVRTKQTIFNNTNEFCMLVL